MGGCAARTTRCVLRCPLHVLRAAFAPAVLLRLARRCPFSLSRLQGPGAYAIPSGIGKQSLSVRPSSSFTRFGTSARDGGRPAAVPGPGTYEVTGIDGLGGRATTSQRPRSATTRFGTSQRMTERGAGGPGPAYSPSFASTTPKSPNWSFPHGDRLGFAPPTTPGPGAYDSALTDSLGRKMATTGHANPAGSPFPKGSRFSSAGNTGNPAPGQYGAPALVTCVGGGERRGRGSPCCAQRL
jgi:hypothetical protein